MYYFSSYAFQAACASENDVHYANSNTWPAQSTKFLIVCPYFITLNVAISPLFMKFQCF